MEKSAYAGYLGLISYLVLLQTPDSTRICITLYIHLIKVSWKQYIALFSAETRHPRKNFAQCSKFGS